MQKNETESLSYAKISSKWIIDLNLRPETIKLTEKKYRGRSFLDNVMDITLKNTKAKIEKWDYIKRKGLCLTKETTKMKR